MSLMLTLSPKGHPFRPISNYNLEANRVCMYIYQTNRHMTCPNLC